VKRGRPSWHRRTCWPNGGEDARIDVSTCGRFPIASNRSLPHVDFVEVILRNFYRYEWEAWADAVWTRRIRPGLPLGGAYDPHTQIKAAFRGSQHLTLAGPLGESVAVWKRQLVTEKLRMCRLSWHDANDHLGY
jgi:hypothetical protein